MDGFPAAERIDAGGVTLSVHAEGPAAGPVVILLHGWPELAYSWKRQVAPLAEAGFRVVAPDGRGFGASDAPEDVAAYGIDHLVSDVAAVIDWTGADQAVVVGHNWGGVLAWHTAMLASDRVAGVVGVNTPHMPRGERPTTESMREYGGDDHYIVRFQEPGLAESVFARSVEDVFRFLFVTPPSPEDLQHLPRSITHLLKRFETFTPTDGHACVMPEADLQVYADVYARTGFTGGLNWYRNMDANWARMDGVDHAIRVPCLMVAAECDAILPPSLTRWMPALIPDLEQHVLPGVGHWTQWEAPDALNGLLRNWLERRFKTP